MSTEGQSHAEEPHAPPVTAQGAEVTARRCRVCTPVGISALCPPSTACSDPALSTGSASGCTDSPTPAAALAGGVSERSPPGPPPGRLWRGRERARNLLIFKALRGPDVEPGSEMQQHRLGQGVSKGKEGARKSASGQSAKHGVAEGGRVWNGQTSRGGSRDFWGKDTWSGPQEANGGPRTEQDRCRSS